MAQYHPITTPKPKMVVATKSNASTTAPFRIDDKEREKAWEFVGVVSGSGEALFEGPMGGTNPWNFSVEWSVEDPTTSPDTETCAVTSGDPS
jgi:hypothetical protein|tara:strand:+ start:1323 stop:1598 length:276 start_codon:yes stop_codon:yes gene_type:complete